MKLIKNIKIGKANFLKLFIIVIFIFYSSNVNSLENSESLEGNFIEIKILDKVSSKNNDEVFIFNGWTFSSSPTIKPFDHPVYDIWLTKCY